MMMQSLPSSSTSVKFLLRLATPSNRCSPAWALSNATWSSSDNALNSSKHLAHSIKINSCSFMLSHTSFIPAIRFMLRSISPFGLSGCWSYMNRDR